MQRYSNIEFVLNLNIDVGIELIIKAMEEKRKDKVFKLYASAYPYMDEENFISFEEFYISITANGKSTDEILEDINSLLSLEWEEVK